ncbi:MAG TPA: hypothetical protein VF094_01585 [Gaiellaceae bacterium]
MAARIGSIERYDVAMGELWPGLASTLSHLDVLACEPDGLDDEAAPGALRRLQYSLHVAWEHLHGLQPPPGAASAHAELADALVCARDATAEVAEAALAWGAEGVAPLLPEWRGALFRVRLARLRLAAPAARRERTPTPTPAALAPALLAVGLALAGALAFVAGATLGLWPVWAAGLVATAAAVLAYRP